jgi:hypothetical protein
VLIASLLAISTVTACTPATGSPSKALDPEAVASRYGYDLGTATLSPVFAIVPEYKNPNDGYARDLLASKCLNGVVEYRAVKPGTVDQPIDDRTHQISFNEQIAAQFGYPQLRMPQPVDSAVPENVTIDDAMMAKMRECGAQTDKRLGAVPERMLSGVEEAGWEAVAGSQQVRDAAEAWRTCMEPVGVVDLPVDPSQMPTPSVVSPQKDAQGNEADTASIPLSDREREVAVADARCRAQVDYDGAVLRARADAELVAIGRDVEGFDAGRRAYSEYEKKIDAVITELG